MLRSVSYSAYCVAYTLRDLHSHMPMHIKKTPLEINFIYLTNKQIYCLLRDAKQSLFYFPQNVAYFMMLFSSVQIISAFF